MSFEHVLWLLIRRESFFLLPLLSLSLSLLGKKKLKKNCRTSRNLDILEGDILL